MGRQDRPRQPLGRAPGRDRRLLPHAAGSARGHARGARLLHVAARPDARGGSPALKSQLGAVPAEGPTHYTFLMKATRRRLLGAGLPQALRRRGDGVPDAPALRRLVRRREQRQPDLDRLARQPAQQPDASRASASSTVGAAGGGGRAASSGPRPSSTRRATAWWSRVRTAPSCRCTPAARRRPSRTGPSRSPAP